jgi:hypothetical protein
MRRALPASAALFLWIALLSPHARAQPSEKDADAERLFREGQTLMAERRFGEACPKFQDAYRKDQQLGTLLNLAYCHKEQGSIWQAWLEFKEAEVKAVELKRPDRKDFARQRMTELEKSSPLARVIVDVPAKEKAELTEVLVEDRRVYDAEKGSTFAAEPGQRKLTFRAKGKKQIVQLVTIHPKTERPQHIAVPEMEDQPKEPLVVEPPVRSPDPPPAVHAKPETPKAEEPSGSGWRTAMYVAFGVGVPILAVGAVTGVMSLGSDCALQDGKRDYAKCPANSEKRNDASTISAISTISLPVGIVAVAAGLGILLFGPSPKSTATVGRVPTAASHAIRMTPEVGAGWAGVRGVF